jgi:hypothetical protein
MKHTRWPRANTISQRSTHFLKSLMTSFNDKPRPHCLHFSTKSTVLAKYIKKHFTWLPVPLEQHVDRSGNKKSVTEMGFRHIWWRPGCHYQRCELIHQTTDVELLLTMFLLVDEDPPFTDVNDNHFPIGQTQRLVIQCQDTQSPLDHEVCSDHSKYLRFYSNEK